MAEHRFEPMTAGQIIDHALRLYRENFARFIAITAMVTVPIGIMSMLVAVPLKGAPAAGLVAILIAALLSIVGQSLCNAALLKTISESYLGNDVSIGQAYKFILPKLFTVIWAGIVYSLVVGLGIVLLVVPGILFMMWYSLMVPVIIIENRKTMPSASRSKVLVSGNLGKVFVVGLVAIIMAIVLNSVFQFAGGFLGEYFMATNRMAGVFLTQLFALIG